MTRASEEDQLARGARGDGGGPEAVGLEEAWFDAKPQSQSRIPLRRSSAPPPPSEPINDQLADGWFR